MPADLARLLHSSASGNVVVEPAKSDLGGRPHPSMLSGVSDEGVLRLLKFNTWLKAMVKADGKTMEKLVEEETANYKDFAMKDGIEVKLDKLATHSLIVAQHDMHVYVQVPEILPDHVLTHNLAEEYADTLSHAYTDFGICTVVNGKSLADTFSASNDRIEKIGAMLDPRPSNKSSAAVKIRGSGRLYQAAFWINVRRGRDQGRKEGSMSMAVTNWVDYFTVRYIYKCLARLIISIRRLKLLGRIRLQYSPANTTTSS